MSALLNSTINKLRTEADARRVELAELDASIEALTKIQGGAVVAIPRKGRKPKVNGVVKAIEEANAAYNRTSDEAKTDAVKAFM